MSYAQWRRHDERLGDMQRPTTDPRVERSRSAVLDAAVTLFVEGGLKAVTVDAVTERSGVAKTTIYRHWPNRDALLVDTYLLCAPPMAQPRDDLAFEDALQALVRSLVAGFAQPHTRASLRHLIASQLEIEEMTDGTVRPEAQYAGLLDVLKKGVVSEDLPDDTDCMEAKHQIFGLILVTALEPPAPLDEAFADRVVELFLASRKCSQPQRRQED